jgi:hypothetical protein
MKFSVYVAVVLSLVHACESFAAPAFGSFSGLRGLGRSIRALSVPMMSSGDSPDVQGNKLLVLGATGFVGSEVARQAVNRGYQVVGISRRGGDSEAAKSELGKKIDWRKGDVSKEGVVEQVLSEGGFAGVVHAVGILLEGDMNKWVLPLTFLPQLSWHPATCMVLIPVRRWRHVVLWAQHHRRNRRHVEQAVHTFCCTFCCPRR